MVNRIDTFTEKVIQEIERVRHDKNMTTQELIDKSGIRRSTYFRKMRGDTDFSTTDIDAISRALNVDPFIIMENAANDKNADDRPFTVNPSALLSEAERIAAAERTASQNDFTQAALRDRNKQAEKEYDADAGA